MTIYILENKIQHYSWGSYDQIPQFLCQKHSDVPCAEMWLGTHSNCSLYNQNNQLLPISQLIQSDLRFLMKVISINEPLSIQCHPDLQTAMVGFQLESKSNLSTDERNYKDSNDKPELLISLQKTICLCGFDDIQYICEELNNFGVNFGQSIDEIVKNVLQIAFNELVQLIQVMKEKTWINQKKKEQFLIAQEIHQDSGLLFFVLLKLIELEPYDAIYIEPGVIHCYLKGFGIEVMKSSDNVLRCGLTKKKIDQFELLKVYQKKNGMIIKNFNKFDSEFGVEIVRGDFELMKGQICLVLKGYCEVSGQVILKGKSFYCHENIDVKLVGEAVVAW